MPYASESGSGNSTQSNLESAHHLSFTEQTEDLTQSAPPGRLHQAVCCLEDPRLFRPWAYFDGKWQQADDRGELEVFCPADGCRIGSVQKLGRNETIRAVHSAREAFNTWKEKLPQERAFYMSRWGSLMMEHLEDLALIMTLEQGKPLTEARAEIDYAAGFLDWFGEEARRINGEVIGGHLPHRTMTVEFQPVGVAAAITPWNFPSAMITRKAGAALAAGCPVIVRPASETPFSALALAELADRAGIPPGVFSVLPGSREIVDELCTSPAVRAVSFTGSTEIGKLLLNKTASTVKNTVLELGGHAPFIIFPDTDLDKAVDAAAAAKFQTSGQDCLAANRIYVHEQIYQLFLEKFSKKVRTLKVGNGLDEGVEIGPLMNSRSVRKCRDHVDDAVQKGARITAGGGQHDAGDLFFTPTVLADVTENMAICREETFGPVAAVMMFRNEDELVKRVNHEELGLISYLYTGSHDRICRLTRKLEYGMVAVNCVKVTGGPIPFGGVKQSGLGREGGHWGLEPFLEKKYICTSYKTNN